MFPNKFRHLARLVLSVALISLTGCVLFQSQGIGKQMLENSAQSALQNLISHNPAAATVNNQAVAVLVFPSIVKGGFVYGGAAGNGVLFINGQPAGIYNSASVSYGLQAGLQDYGYALFFMNRSSLRYLNRSEGLELGVGPSIVVADAGFAKSYSTTTLTQDVYAFVFNQRGLMAGAGITGSKITKVAAP